MIYRLFGSLTITAILLSHCSVESYVGQRRSKNILSGQKQNKRCRSQLQQQRKRAPIGADFIELGSSLITLLNLAQEIGSSNNLRFRQAADKLRDQFARS